MSEKKHIMTYEGVKKLEDDKIIPTENTIALIFLLYIMLQIINGNRYIAKYDGSLNNEFILNPHVSATQVCPFTKLKNSIFPVGTVYPLITQNAWYIAKIKHI